MLQNAIRATRSLCLAVIGAGFLAASLPLSAAATAAAPAAVPMVTQAVDNANRVTLHGNVHPFATSANDRGLADTSIQSPRLQLLLKRPADREAALKQYIEDIHNKNSASYHKWLTPDQLAAQYGPADSDIQAVIGWMQSQGLKINKVSRSKSIIDFGGSLGQVQTAFNTSIHKYAVGGVTHLANATNPQVPAALAPVIRGVARLNDFRPTSQAKFMGSATYNPATHTAKGITGQWNYPEGGGEIFFLAPADFAVQYDTAPLTSAGTNGTGQTIGIINDSNIDLTLVNAFRTVFSLPASTPQVIVDGNDPGISGDSGEAYLDVEWSGAVAPAATINLYIAANTQLNSGLDLAAARAVDDDVAQVLSMSFGSCEQQNGSAENQLYADLWEQAAAQGQTVMVSSGDAGSEACYQAVGQYSPQYGVAVNALASTPYNVAVGGTDFFYSDYAQTPASSAPPSFSNYWSSSAPTNTPSTTLLQTIPEQPWDDSQFGLNIAAYATDPTNPAGIYTSLGPEGAGGGASACALQTDDPQTGLLVSCTGGYPKPSFQATGTPGDSVRDLPDVSSFAALGYNYSATPICANPGDCNTDGNTAAAPVTISGVGGTSVAAPAFAGIMALVTQKYGAQGQADYTLYPLASQFPAAFHDVANGSNNELCLDPTSIVANCVAVTGQTNIFSAGAYSAVAGYDQASGLGTVDANVLVTDWPKVTFTPSATTLALSAATITHGQNETLTANVSGATAGDVSFITSVPLPNSKGLTFANVASGVATLTANYLPGGTYNITAQYSGDGTTAASHSAPQSITVNPEPSNINLVGVSVGPSSNSVASSFITNGSSLPYGTQINLDIEPVGTSVNQPAGAVPGSGTLVTNGAATGTATFTDTGNAGTSTVALNSAGVAEWAAGNFGVGAHSVSASYSGDSSFNASTSSTPVTFTITPGQTQMLVQPLLTMQQVGAGLTVQVIVGSIGYGTAPTGSATVTLGTQTQTGTLSPYYYAGTFQSNGGSYSATTVVFSSVPAGVTSVAATYAGDSNWAATTGNSTFASTAGTLTPTTTALTVAPGTGNTASTLTLSATVSAASGTPTGTVTFYNNTSQVSNAIALGTGDIATITLSGNGINNTGVTGGLNQFVAVYSGDATFLPSTSPAAYGAVDQTDFTLAAQNQTVSVAAGSAGTATVNLGSVNGFNANVNLACTSPDSSITCSVNPATVAVNGSATAAITINVAAASARNESKPLWLAGGTAAIAFVFFFGIPARRRSWRSLLGIMLFAILTANLGCGGSSSGGGGGGGGTITVATPTFSPAGGTYSSPQSVTLASSTAGATIYFTTDGSTPSTSSNKYGSPVVINTSGTLKAIATASGDTNSAVATASYVISTTSGVPTAGTGTNATIHNVTIQVVTPSGTSTVVVTGTVAAAS